MTSLSTLEDFVHRCQLLGITTSGVQYFDDGASAGMDVPDPDGTIIRFHFAPRPAPVPRSEQRWPQQEEYDHPRAAGRGRPGELTRTSGGIQTRAVGAKRRTLPGRHR